MLDTVVLSDYINCSIIVIKNCCDTMAAYIDFMLKNKLV